MNKSTSTNCIFSVSDFTETKHKVLNWLNRFSTFCFLDNHQYQFQPHAEECLVGAGVKDAIGVNTGPALEDLQSFLDKNKGWLFGHLSYDLKNEIETLTSSNPDHLGFPEVFFFQPEVIIRFDKEQLIIECEEDPESIYNEIQNCPAEISHSPSKISARGRLEKEEYVGIIQKLQEHILRGDCYEINFCMEFFSENTVIDPMTVYHKLSKISPNPFSAFYRINEKYLFCASPERFLKKTGKRILSQPIKGTSKRIIGDAEDELSKQQLSESAKDRSENVMVVDLVRNDLSKVCVDGSVKVDELFGIYSFPQVHQMISTISGELKENVSFSEIIRATFPMGSMTGAPKKKVMELIEHYEKTKRGIFSGAVGYINPEGDFDLNVVIRSILYNSERNYLSFQAGSGITFYSDAGKEWEECLLKAEAMMKALS